MELLPVLMISVAALTDVLNPETSVRPHANEKSLPQQMLLADMTVALRVSCLGGVTAPLRSTSLRPSGGSHLLWV